MRLFGVDVPADRRPGRELGGLERRHRVVDLPVGRVAEHRPRRLRVRVHEIEGPAESRRRQSRHRERDLGARNGESTGEVGQRDGLADRNRARLPRHGRAPVGRSGGCRRCPGDRLGADRDRRQRRGDDDVGRRRRSPRRRRPCRSRSRRAESVVPMSSGVSVRRVPVACGIATQEVPLALQRRQRYVNFVGRARPGPDRARQDLAVLGVAEDLRQLEVRRAGAGRGARRRDGGSRIGGGARRPRGRRRRSRRP